MPTGVYKLIWPWVRLLDAESAHGLAIRALKLGLVPVPDAVVHPELAQSLWGLDFPSPVGLAAGFDKNAEVFTPMLAQGFGFVEVGSVTPRPQAGNPKPRLFRLEDERAVINRMGFNNQGFDAVAKRMESRDRARGIVGVNLGKNKDTTDAAHDYELGAARFAALADFLVINVSSPNTPGLRALQGPEPLRELLTRTIAARDEVVSANNRPALLLKIAPDLTDADKTDISHVALEVGIDGLIVSNTTIERPEGSANPRMKEGGGLSGRPLLEMSTQALSEMYLATEGKIPIIGVGGVEDGQSAYNKILAGASLVELYTAMIFEGPDVAQTIKSEMVACMKADGFSTIGEAVGAIFR